MSTTAPTRPTAQRRPGAVIAAVLVLLLGVVSAAVAGGLTWAGTKTDDGYFTSSKERFTSRGYAIATDDLDVRGIPDALGKVRLKLASDQPLFAGVARTRDVDAYLRGSAHTTLTDIDFDPFDPAYRTVSGGAPARPADQRFWTATSTDGTLEWKVRSGTWSVVVMNADGSRGVDTDVSAGATFPFLDDLELAAWIAAAAFLALGGALLAVGLSPRRTPSAPAESAWAA